MHNFHLHTLKIFNTYIHFTVNYSSKKFLRNVEWFMIMTRRRRAVVLAVSPSANQSSSVEKHTLHGDIGNQKVIKLNSFPLFRGGGSIV